MRPGNALTIVLAIAMILSAPISTALSGTPFQAAIDNAGFEDPVLVDGDWDYSLDDEGWGYFDNDGYVGSWNPTTAEFALEAPLGDNVGWTEPGDGVPGGFAQVLVDTLMPGASYTLTVDVGNGIGYEWGGYSVQLLAGGIPHTPGTGANYTGAVTGGVLLAEDNNTLTMTPGTFVPSTVSYTFDPGLHLGSLGDSLQIRLLALGGDEVEFDNVSLTITPPDKMHWDGDTGDWGDVATHTPNSHWLIENVTPTADIPTLDVGANTFDYAVVGSGAMTVAANRSAYSLEITGGSATVASGVALNIYDMTSVSAAGALTVNGSLNTEKLNSAAEVAIGSGAAITANSGTISSIAIADNGTLVKSGDGTLAIDAIGAVGSGTSIQLDGGILVLRGEGIITTTFDRLEYGFYDNAAHENLREIDDGIDGNATNGGLFNLTPTSGGFVSNAINRGSISDTYVEMWSGNFNPDVTGDYVFYVHGDDNEVLWMDLDQNGEFNWVDVNANGILDSGEGDVVTANDIPETWNLPRTFTVSLVAGEIYPFAMAHAEGTGGDQIQFSVDGVDVNPSDPGQAGWWSTQGIVLQAIDMSSTSIDVMVDSTLVAKTATTAIFGDLTISDGATLTIEEAPGGTTFATIAPIAPSAEAGIISDSSVTINSGLILGDASTFVFTGNNAAFNGALTMGDGAAATFSGNVAFTGGSSFAGTSATIGSGAALDLGGPLSIGPDKTLNVAGSGSVTISDLQATGTTASPATINFSDGAILTAMAFTDGGAGSRLNLTGAGSLQLDSIAGGTIAAAGTTFSVAPGATLDAFGPDPMGAAGSMVSLDGGTAMFSVGGVGAAPVGEIANWKFDEIGGTTAFDSSGNGHDGMLTNGVTVNQAARGGTSGTSFYFDGTDDFVGVPAGIDISSKSFTLSVWVKRELPAANDYIMGQGPGNNNLKLHFGFRDADNATLAFYANDSDHVDNAQYTDTSEWHHLVGTYDVADNTRHIYWDGVDQTPLTNNPASSPFLATGEFLLGQANNNFFQGWLDDLYVYDSALNAKSVLELYNGRSAKADGDLDMTSTDFVVTADSKFLSVVNETASASYGVLTINDGMSLDIESMNISGASFTSLTPIAAGATADIQSNRPVNFGNALTLGDGATFSFSGETASFAGISWPSASGTSATIGVNSTVNLGGPLPIGAGQTLNIDGAGVVETSNLQATGTIASPAIIDFSGGATLTAPAFTDGGGTKPAVNQLNLIGAGTLALNGSAGSIDADGTIFSVGADSTLNTAAGAIGAGGTTINLDGGTFETSGADIVVSYNGLMQYGYHTGPNGVMDLNNAGGMMGGGDPTQGPTFYGQAELTSGPGGRGLDFNNDGDFRATGAVGQDNNYSNMWLGVLIPDESGNWSFRRNADDDRVGIWLDIDQDGVFESTAAGLSTNNGEQLMWEDTGTKTVVLTAGQEYMIAFTHSEGSGGSQAEFQFQSPSLSMRTIKPLDAAQAELWRYKAPGLDAFSMLNTDIIVTADSNLIANSNTTAAFGDLTLTSGILNVSGAAGGVTFNSIGAPIASDAVAGVVSDAPVTLNGTLVIGDRADVTLSESVNITGGITFTDDGDAGDIRAAVIRPVGTLDFTSFDYAGQDVALTAGGSGTLNMTNLGSAAADQTSFTAQNGTIEFSGATPLGGSSLALNMAGGTIRIEGMRQADPGSLTLDFSSGTLDGWNVGVSPVGSNAAFTTGRMPYDRGGGNLAVKTDQNGLGDGDTGIIRSDPFVLDGGTINFQMAGGNQAFSGDPDTPDANMLAVTLEREVAPGDWEMVESAVISNSNNFSAKSWDASAYNVGDTFRIGIYDTYTGGWGKVGMDDMVISSILTYTYEGINLPGTGVIVTDASTLDAVTDTTASFGVLSFNGQGILTTSGAADSISFTAATITSATGDIGFDTLTNTHAGPLNFNGTGATIIKTGAADLVLDSSDPTNSAGAGFDVRAGRLIARAGSNPLGVDSAVGINGGEVVLISSAMLTDVTFDNPITSTGGTLTAGANGGVNTGPLTVTVGNAITNNLTLTSGTLNLQTLDDYMLNIAGDSLGGELGGSMTIGPDSIVTAAKTIDAGSITIGENSSLSVVGTVTVNELIGNEGAAYNGLSDLTVRNTLTLNSGIDLSGAGLVVDGADVTVSNGTLMVGNSLGSALTPVAGVDVSEGGGLTLNGNSLTTQKLITTGGSFDMGVTGSFIATGDVAIAPAGGPNQLELSGGVMTITATSGSLAPDGALSHYAFDGTTDDTGSLANTAGVMTGAAGYAAGKFGQAMSLSGNNADYFDTNQDAPYDFQNGSVTFALWVQLDQDGWNDGWEAMIAKGEGTTWRLARNGGNQDLIGYGNGGANGTADLRDNEWHQFIVRADQGANSSEMFFDGVSIATGTASLTDNRGEELFIGNNPGSTGRSFGGLIDDVYIYDRWLTDDEVADLYANDHQAPDVYLPGTNLLMTATTTLDLASDTTLGNLTVNNASPTTLTFTGDSELRLNLANTLLTAAVTGQAPGLTIDTAPKVNLGVLDLAATDAPVIEKAGSGQWIITEAPVNYTGAATYNVDAGTLVLGNTGLLGAGGVVNIADGAVLKLSSTTATKTYNDTINLSLTGSTILAGMADSNAVETAVVTLPSLPTSPTQSVTLGAADAGYNLTITNPVTADALSLGGVGTVTLAAGGDVKTATVGTTGTIDIATPLTVTEKITLGDIPITDNLPMAIMGDNLADPNGTITVSGTAFTMGANAPDGAIANWKFDETSGTTAADSTGGNDAAIGGSILLGQAARDGATGTSFYFPDGENLVTAAGGAGGIELDNRSFTLAAWAKRENPNGDYFFGQGVAGGNNALHAGFRNNQEATFAFYGDDSDDNDIKYDNTDWHHLVFTYDATNNDRHIYWDGADQPVDANPANADYAGTGTFRIGSRWDGNDNFQGWLDDLYVYDSMLDAAQVTQLYNASGVVGTGTIDMPNLSLDLNPGVSTIALNAKSATLGDLALGDNTTLTITGTQVASFNNVTINAAGGAISGTALSTTIRGTLSTEGGSNLTANLTVGDLTMVSGAAMNVVSGTVTASNLTNDGGLIAFGGTSSLNVSGTLTQNAGFTAQTAGASIDVTNLNVTGGTLNAAAVTVSDQANIGEHVVATTDGTHTFDVSGSNVLSAHTLTLNGGTMTLQGESTAGTVIVDDFAYPDGVFDGTQNGGAGWTSPWTLTGNAGSWVVNTERAETVPSAATQTGDISRDFDMSQPANTTLYFRYDADWAVDAEGGYETTLQFLGGEVEVGLRSDKLTARVAGNTQVSASVNGQTAMYNMVGRIEFDPSGVETLTFWVNPVDEASAPILTATAELGQSDLGTTAVFNKSGQDNNRIFVDNFQIGTNFGFTAASGSVDLSATTLATTVDSTALIVGEHDAIILGGLEAAGGTVLTIDSATTDIQLTNMTLGGGSQIRSIASDAETDQVVTFTIADGGTLTAGDGISQLGDWDDQGFTYLTLGDVTYNWTFGTEVDNYLEVAGDLTFNGAGALTLNILDGGGLANGADVALFNIGQVSDDPAPIYLPFTIINLPEGWTSGSIVHRDDVIFLENLVTGIIAVDGDANGDQNVDADDLAIFQAQFGGVVNGLGDADFNGDGFVTLADFAIMRGNWGATAGEAPSVEDLSATPEPATMSLLAIGGMLMLRRRRRKA
jgi:fibronectin-binding autotransporter adhesin